MIITEKKNKRLKIIRSQNQLELCLSISSEKPGSGIKKLFATGHKNLQINRKNKDQGSGVNGNKLCSGLKSNQINCSQSPYIDRDGEIDKLQIPLTSCYNLTLYVIIIFARK